jgi:hypothetical protein
MQLGQLLRETGVERLCRRRGERDSGEDRKRRRAGRRTRRRNRRKMQQLKRDQPDALRRCLGGRL